MRNMVIGACALCLVLPSALPAEVVLRPYDSQAAERPVHHDGSALGSLAPKVDALASLLFVPFFDVDTTDPAGTTTLFAVRNANPGSVDFGVFYLAPDGSPLRQDTETLGGLETFGVNVRDVAGLPSGPDGFARGFIAVNAPGDFFTGDYFQVDVARNFATGERLISVDDFCQAAEVRFLSFGLPTEVRILLNQPQGTDAGSDPPSFVVHVVGEDGGLFPGTNVFTDQYALTVSSSDFTGLSFGTMLFDFGNSNGGAVYAEYAADGKFSVGLNGACLVP